jgi:hypothetical protein
MAENDLTGGRGSIPRGSAAADIRARFKIDNQSLKEMSTNVKDIKSSFMYLNQNLASINTKLDTTYRTLAKIAGLNLSNLSGGAAAGGGKTQYSAVVNPFLNNTSANAISAPQIYAPRNTFVLPSPAGPSGGGYGGVDDGPVRGSGAFAGLTQILSTALQAMDARTNSGYAKAQSADKLGVYYQQVMGISQQQYQSQVRQPMTGRMLGEGGINTLLALQAQTGINAQQNVAGVEGLRALSGFSLSTGDIAGMAQNLGSAQTNNRMTMMLGTGLYGPGGKQRSIDQVVKDIARNSGLLSNPTLVKGARQSGSVTRTRLSAMGVSEDIQNLVFDYAEGNNTYRSKGGKGDYDPSSAAQRKLMGIEDNFATQAEKTTMVKDKRDEQFYKDQADNYAKMEKGIQATTKALADFEHKLRGIVGVGISTKGGLARKGIGAAMMLGGGIASMTGAGAAFGVPLMMLGGQLAMGDGSMPAGNTMVPTYGKSRISFNQMQNSGTVRGLNSKFRDRLFQMIADNPNVGIGQGSRSESEQRQLFLSRYKKDPNGEVNWEGENWKRVSGAPATPPGHSMHEIGLAADLVGDLDWVQENAGRYGLKTFGGVNGEPWHVQPAELPNSRFDYEKGGAQWGMPAGSSRGAVAIDNATGQPIGSDVVGDKYQSQSVSNKPTTYDAYQGLGTVEQMGVLQSRNQVTSVSTKYSKYSGNTNVDSTLQTNQTSYTLSAGAIKGEDLAKLLYKRGFRGDHLVNMLAIAGRESNWKPGAHNGKPPDNSYGLFQINMLGKLGPDRLKKFNISKYEDLFDPETNIKAAWILSGGVSKNLAPWGIKGDALAKTGDWMPRAQAAAKSAGVDKGDPMPMGAPTRSGSTNVAVGGDTHISIAPVINLTGGGGSERDARKLSEHLIKMVETELKKQAMRTN